MTDGTLEEFFSNLRSVPAGVIFPNVHLRDALLPGRGRRSREPHDAFSGFRVMVNHYLPPDAIAFTDRDGSLLGIVYGVRVP